MADSGAEKVRDDRTLCHALLKNSGVDEAISNFCTRDQTSRTSYVDFGIYVCACVLVSIDKTRQFEKPGGYKGDWTRTRGTHVNSIGIYISAPLIPISDCFFVMQPPESAISRLLFAHMRSLEPESRVHCCSVEIPVR